VSARQVTLQDVLRKLSPNPLPVLGKKSSHVHTVKCSRLLYTEMDVVLFIS
jgi:hypothetical protein